MCRYGFTQSFLFGTERKSSSQVEYVTRTRRERTADATGSSYISPMQNSASCPYILAHGSTGVILSMLLQLPIEIQTMETNHPSQPGFSRKKKNTHTHTQDGNSLQNSSIHNNNKQQQSSYTHLNLKIHYRTANH